MALIVDGTAILDEFQMDSPVTVLSTPQILSRDPFLPANNVASLSARLEDFVQGAGGWDDVNRAVWYTRLKVSKGTACSFAGKNWTIVDVADWNSTSFTNVFFYKLQESSTLQNKPAVPFQEVDPYDKWQ